MTSCTSPQWFRIFSTMLAQNYKILGLKLPKRTKRRFLTDIIASRAFQGLWKRIFSPKSQSWKKVSQTTGSPNSVGVRWTLLMRKRNHAFLLLAIVLAWKKTDRFASRRWSLKNKLGDRMIKQLFNSVIAKYRDLPVFRTSIICLSLRLRQIIDPLATDKSRYFAQPRPIIVNYCIFC